MKILIIDNHTKNLTKLVRLFKDFQVDVIDCDNFSIQKTSDYDIIILSGGTHVSAAESTKKAYELETFLIKKINKPIIGICLGSQLIAKAYGGKLKKLEKKSHGIIELTYKTRTYKVCESHKYAIEKLPKQLQLLGKSSIGPEIFKHKIKPIYGFQFHPESMPRKSDGKKLFFKVLKTILA